MCFAPIKLKNGEVVPCGHCEECYSMRRNEWSVRLQLHTLNYDRMPLFVTLTYDNEHLPETGLKKKDLQDFIKRVRDKYNLYNTKFSYFGCGERGDLFGRGHYHLLMYGMPQYEDVYYRDDELCRQMIEEDWKNGNVFVCVADWSGIHYVTKYVLKHLDKNDENFVKPFTLCSKGIGLDFVNSDEFAYIKRCVNVERYREVLETCPELDQSSAQTLLSTSNQILSVLKPFVESCKVTLPSGQRVPLPRYFRKKLYGSFEHWSLNPFAYYRYVQRMNRYAKDVINGINMNRDKVAIIQQQFLKRMLSKGHFVKPNKNFNVK